MRSQEIQELKAKIDSTSSYIASVEKSGGDVSLLSKKIAQYTSDLSELLRDEGNEVPTHIAQPRGWSSE
jgi:prefoldin subunit 5